MTFTVAGTKLACAGLAFLGLSACGWTDLVVPSSGLDHDCQVQAREHVNSNVIDKYWREHEYHSHYQACIAGRD